jgi:hypothetical protein
VSKRRWAMLKNRWKHIDRHKLKRPHPQRRLTRQSRSQT